MLKERGIITIIVCCTFFITLVSAAAAATETADNMFVCDLEVNKVGPKPADTIANGNVIFLLDEEKNELSYKIHVEDIEDVYMAHLHMGPSKKEGIIATWLYPVDEHDSENRTIEGEFTGTLAEGVIRQEDLKHGITLEEIIESLGNGNSYVSVHTKNFVMGAVRGQVYLEGLASQMEKNPTAAGNNQ